MDSCPTVLSVCAGIGGLDLAVKRVFPTSRLVCAVEVEAFPAAVLAHQMAAGALDAAPIWSDLRAFDARAWRGCVDILTAGFPCQPFSAAGKRGGDTDPRHLWPHVRRAINGARPRLVFLENVPGLLTVRCAGGRTAYELVRSELQRLAYRVEAVLVTASEVGAPHKRERLFILGVADGDMWGCGQHKGEMLLDRERPTFWHDVDGCGGAPVADASKQFNKASRPVWPPGPTDAAEWAAILALRPDLAPATQPGVRGVADGVSTRVDELRAYGNAVVPAQGAYALRLLLGGEA